MLQDSTNEDPVECPLCMETLEIDDVNFYPCTCGYQICRFCWHRIRTDENGLCPACRKAYPECPADFKPLSEEELQRIKSAKRQKDIQRKQKITENRKHLASVRVVQKNLVFVVGLSQRLADTEILKKQEYFGKFGKIVKVVINPNTSYAGAQGPSASAYVTYQKQEEALRAIQAVNNVHVDGRTLKASLGTTKYCSHFLKNSQCPKQDCMYLHELGDEAASFTKEDMQQGKHQEYEQKLLQDVFKGPSQSSSGSSGGTTSQTQVHTNSTTTTTTATTETAAESSRPENILSRKKQTSSPPLLAQSPQSNSPDPWPVLLKEQTNGVHHSNTVTDLPPSLREPATESEAIPIRQSTTDLPKQTPPHTPDVPLISNSPLLSSRENSLSPVGEQNGPPPQHTMTTLLQSEKDASSSSFFSGREFLPPGSTMSAAPPPPGLSSTNILPSVFNGWGESLGSLSNDILPVDSQTDWQAAFGFDSEEKDPKDDDLGFDPWNESSKGLAALLEKELQLNSTETDHPAQPPPYNNSLNKASSSFSAMMTQPPPGFVIPPNHLLPIHGNGSGRQPSRPDGIGGGGGSKMFTWMRLNHPAGSVQHPLFPGLPPTQIPPVHEHHHLRYPPPPMMSQTNSQKSIPSFQPMQQNPTVNDRQSIKAQQDSLRELLPNTVKIHFDSSTDFSGLYPRKPPHSSTTNGTDGLPEEQPHWMQSLHKLTEGESPTQTHTNSLFPPKQMPQGDIFS
ncbi:CCR4-NOT transcription complex subunit 4-like isoform X2 [Apostichopus japonicus]|uniref:CCR4-NOT transcription complex subunit 4-like isoform X2 n=1 Tax=Stichopus japonicus TaxID=307972 RepID=UPI003AB622F4